MNIPLQDYQSEINSQVLDMLMYFKHETSIPPMLTCLQASIFCLANVHGFYQTEGREAPKELVEFMKVGYPKLLADLEEQITKQYLMLNTEGTA